MRIVHLEAGRHLYGGAQQVRHLLAGLAGLGVDNLLVCRSGSALAGAVTGVEVVELALGGDADVAQLERLRRLFKRVAPDLVHVHSRRGADLYGGWAARLASRPAVLTRRVDDLEPERWARLKLKPYTAIIAISQAIERRLTGAIGIDAARVYRVASGVGPAFDRRGPARARLAARLALTPDGPLLGVVAQLIPRKGHAVLLEALAALTRVEPNLRLVCFGRGPLARELRGLAEARGVAKAVCWAGFRDDLAELLPGLDLLVHPALREGLGVAVLEALAAGVPVVASATGGLVDVIRDGVEGRLVPPGDAEALAATVAMLLADPGARARMAAAGRTRVEREFTAARMAAAHLPIYEAVLRGRHGRH